MRDITPEQDLTLDRIGNSAAGPHARVVGWAERGPVLRIKKRLVLVNPSGSTEPVNELEATIA